MEKIIWTTGHRLKFGNIIHSDNCFVFDENGKRLVDLESGVRLDPALTVRTTTIVDFLNAFGQVLENVSEKKKSVC